MSLQVWCGQVGGWSACPHTLGTITHCCREPLNSHSVVWVPVQALCASWRLAALGICTALLESGGRCHQAGCRCAAAGLSAPAAWYWVPTTRKMPLLSMQETDLPPEQGDKATSTPHNPAPPPCKLQGQMPQGPGVTSCAISPGEVSTLDHEVLDHTMEFAVFVAKSFLEKRVSG